MLVSVTVLFVCIFGFQLFKKLLINYVIRNNAEPPITVSAMQVHYQDWQPTLLTYGSLRAVKGVNVTTESAGLVRKVYFKSGSEVKQGDVLVQLNADADNALLQALQAQQKLAEITYHRDSAQFKIKAISKAMLDADEQNLQNLQSRVSQQAAIVAKKTLIAPFAGRLGISTINPGQYLNVGEQVVTLQALNPLYADFYVPQQNLVQLHFGDAVKIKTDTYPNKTFDAAISAINPIVDSETRNVKIEATVENPQFELYPGMFVSAEITTGKKLRYLTLPQTAISFNPYGQIAYIVQRKDKDPKGQSILSVIQTFVETGETRGDQITILKGLKEGDTVVTSGQLKLKNGSHVVIDNSVVPGNKVNPKIDD